MEDKINLATQAHRIGVEDAKKCILMLMRETLSSDEEYARVLQKVENLAILPTRLWSELLQPELTK